MAVTLVRCQPSAQGLCPTSSQQRSPCPPPGPRPVRRSRGTCLSPIFLPQVKRPIFPLRLPQLTTLMENSRKWKLWKHPVRDPHSFPSQYFQSFRLKIVLSSALFFISMVFLSLLHKNRFALSVVNLWPLILPGSLVVVNTSKPFTLLSISEHPLWKGTILVACYLEWNSFSRSWLASFCRKIKWLL